MRLADFLFKLLHAGRLQKRSFFPIQVPHRKHTKGNGKNSGGREALKSRSKGTRREAILGGRQDRVVQGVATLDRSPDRSPGVRPISPSH